MNKIDVFLAQAEPIAGSNRFLIGAFEKGITLYRQQVRALNLVYCVHEAQRLEPNGAIAVIGGGMAGVTAAAAAAVLGYEVYLFERHSVLLHLQQGCDTRWIHPHLYDWPRPGSEAQHAGLPLLSWRASTSAEVAQQVLRDFARFRSTRGLPKIHLHRNVEVEIRDDENRVSWNGSSGEPRNREVPCDAIFYAVGFGYESGVERGTFASYWRNDSLSQPVVGNSGRRRKKFLVSGTGDGGLIDVLRIRIHVFNHGRIIGELFDDCDRKTMEELISIRSEYDENMHNLQETWLFDRYTGMARRRCFVELDRKIKNRLRQDTEVILNGRDRFPVAMRLDKASLFNTLMIHRLYAKDEEFSYIKGQCACKSATSALLDDEQHTVDEIILRHGTDRAEIIKSTGTGDESSIVRSDTDVRVRLNTTGSRLWPAAWWGDNTLDMAKPLLGGERIEFVSPSTSAIASTFVRTLGNILIGESPNDKDFQFRLTLHRLTSIAGEEYFQQITPYAGTRIAGQVGRVFRTDAGLIGLVASLGRPIYVDKDDKFDDLWYSLRFDQLKAQNIDHRVNSLFACPFFSKVSSKRFVNLVLFADSSHKGFFSVKILRTIYLACRGFVKSVEEMVGDGELIVSSSDYPGAMMAKNKAKFKVLVDRFQNTSVDDQIFAEHQRDLTFSSVRSFDIALKVF